MRSPLLTIALAVALAGCASGYQQFYVAAEGATPALVAELRAAPPPATPLLERAAPGDPGVILDAYAKRGYNMIGHSLFNTGRSEPEAGAIQQGRDVGADLVLILDPVYTGTATAVAPIVTPTTSTSRSTATATVYGPGGVATGYASGVTTTRSSSVSYVPVSARRFDLGAVYFVKQRYWLGVFTRDLDDTDRQRLQTNKGVVVTLVVDNTPAFEADLLIGDVISAIDGLPVATAEAFSAQLRERRGRSVQLQVIRKDQRLTKSIRLNG